MPRPSSLAGFAGLAAPLLLLACLLPSPHAPHAASASPLPDLTDVQGAMCKDICSAVPGLSVLYKGECICVLDHEPVRAEEAVRVQSAVDRGRDSELPVTTTVVGYDQSRNPDERSLIGLTAVLSARAAAHKARLAALSKPAVTVARDPVSQGAVAFAPRAAQGAATSSVPAAGPAGTVPVALPPVPLPVHVPGLPVAPEKQQAVVAAPLALRERTKARAAAGPEAAGADIVAAAASAASPRFAGRSRDLVVAPVHIGEVFGDSPTGYFSSLAGGMMTAAPYQEVPYQPPYQEVPYQPPYQTAPYQPPYRVPYQEAPYQGPYQAPYHAPFQTRTEVIVNQTPFLRDSPSAVGTAAQRAADTGVGVARSAVQQATDLASSITGGALGAARDAVSSGRLAASAGLRMADDALGKARELSTAALRNQMKAAEDTAKFMVPPGSTDGGNGGVQARQTAPPVPPALSNTIMNPGVYYPDIRAAAVQASASAPQLSVLSQRSVDGKSVARQATIDAAQRSEPTGRSWGTIGTDLRRYKHAAVREAEPRGVLSDAAGAVENAAHSVAHGLQSGTHAVVEAVENAYHGVASGVHSGATSAADLAEDAYHGAQGLASSALDSAGHGLQHAAHQVGAHPAYEGSAARAAEAEAQSALQAARDALQAAASQTVQAVQAVRGAAGAARDVVTSGTAQGVNAAQSAQTAALQRVQDAAGHLQGSVRGVAGAVQGQLQGVVDQVRGTVDGVAGQGAQAVRGVTDSVKSTVQGAASDVQGQVQHLQQAVKGSVLDAQNAARDAILSVASQGANQGQRMTQSALDTAQSAVSAAIEKVKQAMNVGTIPARSSFGLGALRSAYQGLQNFGANQGYQQQGYPPQGYPPQGYLPQGYPPQGYPPQAYQQQGYPPQGYPPQTYPAQQGYTLQSYTPQGYPQQQTFLQPAIPQQSFPQQQGFQPPAIQAAAAPGGYPSQASSWAEQAIDGIASDAVSAGLGAARGAPDAPGRPSQDGLGMAQAAVSALPLGWAGRSAANLGLGLAADVATGKSSGTTTGGSATWRWSPAGTTISTSPGGAAPGPGSGVDVSVKHQQAAAALRALHAAEHAASTR